jgi:hypothetical protein
MVKIMAPRNNVEERTRVNHITGLSGTEQSHEVTCSCCGGDGGGGLGVQSAWDAQAARVGLHGVDVEGAEECGGDEELMKSEMMSLEERFGAGLGRLLSFFCTDRCWRWVEVDARAACSLGAWINFPLSSRANGFASWITQGRIGMKPSWKPG